MIKTQTLDDKLKLAIPEYLTPTLDYETGREALDNIEYQTISAAFPFLENQFFKEHPKLQKIMTRLFSEFVSTNQILSRKTAVEKEIFSQNEKYITSSRRTLTQKQEELKQLNRKHLELDAYLLLHEQKIDQTKAKAEALLDFEQCIKNNTSPSQTTIALLENMPVTQADFSYRLAIQDLDFEREELKHQYDRISLDYVSMDREIKGKELELTAIRNQILIAQRSLNEKRKATSGYVGSGLMQTLNEQVEQAKIEGTQAEAIDRYHNVARRLQEGLEDALPLLERPFPTKKYQSSNTFESSMNEYSNNIQKGMEDVHSQVKEIRFKRYGR
jgi:hypothetical protein